jgi:hypothetical protein
MHYFLIAPKVETFVLVDVGILSSISSGKLIKDMPTINRS